MVFASWDFTNLPCGLVTQIIHVSHLFIICWVKQILQSLDSNELQFCCFFVFVAVEFFFLAYVWFLRAGILQIFRVD